MLFRLQQLLLVTRETFQQASRTSKGIFWTSTLSSRLRNSRANIFAEAFSKVFFRKEIRLKLQHFLKHSNSLRSQCVKLTLSYSIELVLLFWLRVRSACFTGKNNFLQLLKVLLVLWNQFSSEKESQILIRLVHLQDDYPNGHMQFLFLCWRSQKQTRLIFWLLALIRKKYIIYEKSRSEITAKTD